MPRHLVAENISLGYGLILGLSFPKELSYYFNPSRVVRPYIDIFDARTWTNVSRSMYPERSGQALLFPIRRRCWVEITRLFARYCDLRNPHTDNVCSVLNVCIFSMLTICRYYDILGSSRHLKSFSANNGLIKIRPGMLHKPSIVSCWHALFLNRVISSGFPIHARQEGVGLEISFEYMVAASRCLSLLEYDHGLIAHGLTSILIPMAELKKDDAFVTAWTSCGSGMWCVLV
jgi:hypothetical protein